jgi:pimeloyl-ACP methyl ester carboxylesterase
MENLKKFLVFELRVMPTLIVWGGRDHTIPVQHGLAARDAAPGSRFELLEKAAHFPHLEDPEGLARVLGAFLSEPAPASAVDAGAWRGLVSNP